MTSASKQKADQVELSQSAEPVGITLLFLVRHSGRVHGNDRQTHGPSTITPAAHVRRGLIILYVSEKPWLVMVHTSSQHYVKELKDK